jgi:hypothetical protein
MHGVSIVGLLHNIMEKIPMGLMMMEELVRDLINAKCSYEQIVEAVLVRKPLGETISEEESVRIREMIEESKIGQQVGNLGDYYRELESLDWFYEYSDDHRVWKEGSTAYASAREKKYTNREFYDLWDSFVSYINGKTEKPKYVGSNIH